jgi:hypothetical protein
MFSQSQYYWQHLDPREVATLLAFIAIAYGTAIIGVARNRCGSPVISLGIIAWWNRLFDFAPATRLAFRSPLQAQFWLEWRRKGWLMPAAVLFVLLLGGCAWLLLSRNTDELFEALITGGGLLFLLGIVGGLVIGDMSSNEWRGELGPFQATRPITTPDLAQVILKVAASSVISAWLVWATACLVVYVILAAVGSVPDLAIWDKIGWWYFPATLLGLWTPVTVLASVGLAGRMEVVVKLVCGVLLLVIGLPLFLKFALSDAEQVRFLQGAAILSGIALLMTSIGILVTAWRRRLISGSSVLRAAGFESGLLALVTLFWRQQPDTNLSTLLLLVGVSFLTVAPWGAAPLALAWNRNR